MKKIILTGAILSTFFAQAQQGIGTNTPDKSSVLDLQSSKRGLLIPRIELKATDNAAPVNSPANSLLVYNTATDGTGDTAVTPGYYFWNETGSKWVRMMDSQSNSELWAQRDNSGITETYLKAADTNSDFVGYQSNRKYRVNLGQFTDADGIITPFIGRNYLSFYNEKVPYSVALSSDVLPNDTSIGNQFFSSFSNVIRENNVASYAGNYVYYTGQTVTLSTKDVTTPINGGMTGLSSLTNHLSEAPVKRVTGTISFVHIGDETHNATVEEYANGFYGSVVANSGSTIEKAVAISAGINNYGTIKNAVGIQNITASQNSHKGSSNLHPDHTIESMLGINNRVIVAQNATVESLITGTDSRVDISENVTMTANKLIYGNYNRIRLGSALSENTVYANRNIFELNVDGAGAKNVYLNQSMISSSGTGTSVAEDVYGFDFRNSNANNWTANNIYGVHLSSITNGTSGNYGLYIEDVESSTAPNNYSIYTKKGDVRVGELADAAATGDRVVGVDEHGVLKITQLNAVGSKTINFDSGTHDLSSSAEYSNNFISVVINATIGTGNVEIKLPPAVAANLGQMISVRITNTTEPTGAQEVVIKNSADEELSYGQLPYQSWIFKSDGTTWEKI